MNPTPIVSHISARNIRPLENFKPEEYQSLSKIGIHFNRRQVGQMMAAAQETGMDSIEAALTTATVTNPIQFLQNWLPGFVNVITQARKIDEIVGITTAGAWEDEEIVQGYLENLGTAVVYGDYTNVPLSSWNVNFYPRTVVRFEEGMQVGLLEDARASRVKINSADQKRQAATVALEINRNSIGFNGFNSGANYTFGFLNDPNLPAFVEVTPGAESGAPTAWASKSFLEIVADLRTGYATLRTQSGDNIDPEKASITLAIATDAVDQLTMTTDYGVSVWDWIKKTYPNTRVVSAPELNLAHSGDNVFYMFAETVADGSTDDNKTFVQIVPAKFKVLGIEQRSKGYVEDYSNATAGILCKRPYAVYRAYGI